MVESFLLGIVSITSIMAGMFFFKFWRRTRDSLFLSFSIAFTIEGLNRAAMLSLKHPNEGKPWMYLVRLAVFLLILSAILKKNYSSQG